MSLLTRLPNSSERPEIFAAMELGQVDLLGFSIGSFVAQEIALILIRPALVNRDVLASSAPKGAGHARMSGRRDWRCGYA